MTDLRQLDSLSPGIGDRRGNLRCCGGVALHFRGPGQASVANRAVGRRTTWVARNARLAVWRGAERTRQRIPFCSTSVSLRDSTSAMISGHDPSARPPLRSPLQKGELELDEVLLAGAAAFVAAALLFVRRYSVSRMILPRRWRSSVTLGLIFGFHAPVERPVRLRQEAVKDFGSPSLKSLIPGPMAVMAGQGAEERG
jgi:hypothetical protein